MALSSLIKQRGGQAERDAGGGGSWAGPALLWGAVVSLPCSGAAVALSCLCVRAEVLTVPRGEAGRGGPCASWWGDSVSGEGVKGSEYIREHQ